MTEHDVLLCNQHDFFCLSQLCNKPKTIEPYIGEDGHKEKE